MLEIASSHDASLEDAGPQQVLREEPAQPREPHDLRVPAAQDVVGAVVARVELDGAQGLVADDAGAADPLLLPHGERRAARRRRPGRSARPRRSSRPPRRGGPGARPGRRASRARGSSRCRGSARPGRAGRGPRASWPRRRSSRAPAPPRSGPAPCGRSCTCMAAMPSATWSADRLGGQRQRRRARAGRRARIRRSRQRTVR